jgi:hypothetical protein
MLGLDVINRKNYLSGKKVPNPTTECKKVFNLANNNDPWKRI